MYRIIHPMNNNVALVQNELQQELIVIGSGIAFGKKKNDLVADDSWFAVRPSGTEPKIKFYIATVGESEADAKEKIANIEAEINAFVGE